MFRRPTDDSSSDSSSDEEIEVSRVSSKKSNTKDEQSSDTSQHAGLITASLLEFHYHVRAAELLNATNEGSRYDRNSPEAKALARKMFAKSSHFLASRGLLAEDLHKDELKDARDRYLAGVDSLGVEALKNIGALPPLSQLSIEAADPTSSPLSKPVFNSLTDPRNGLLSLINQISMPSPFSAIQLSAKPPPTASRYETEFSEVRLLGRGGFGSVHQVMNFVDNQSYAIKRIALDPSRLKRKWKEGGNEEIEKVLREIRTLATLEHSNIVRYYGAWIEGPNSPSPGAVDLEARRPPSARNLITDGPFQANLPDAFDLEVRRPPSARNQVTDGLFQADLPEAVSDTDGIIFGEDSIPQPSRRSTVKASVEEEATSSTISLSNETDIFTDGDGRNVRPKNGIGVDQITLCLQMSLHPLNLANYLSPLPLTPQVVEPRSSVTDTRHCFHLQPALSIFLGILSGVQYLHATGIVHRDIKPANIFLSEDHVPRPGFSDVSCPTCHRHWVADRMVPEDQVRAVSEDSEEKCSPLQQSARYLNARIGDFGLVGNVAEELSTTTSSSEQVIGTELYRPPQLPTTDISNAKGTAKIDEKIDVFALGVLLFELLWRFDTKTERFIVLSALTKSGMFPAGFTKNLDRPSGADRGIGDMIEDCITGMVNGNSSARWNCDRVKNHIQHVLRMCSSAQ